MLADVQTDWNGITATYEVGLHENNCVFENNYDSNGTGRAPPDATPVYHRSDYSLPVAHDNDINDGLNSYYYGFSNPAFECLETSPENDITGESWWVSDLNKPEAAIRDESLMDFKPEAWELSKRDLQTMFTDYFYDENDGRLEIAAAQARTVAADRVLSFEDDGFTPQIKGNPESNTYWTDFYGQLRNEQWTEHKLDQVTYAYEVNEWLMDPQDNNCEHENENTVREPKLIMATDRLGRVTHMASVVMVIKSLQGRPCSNCCVSFWTLEDLTRCAPDI